MVRGRGGGEGEGRGEAAASGGWMGALVNLVGVDQANFAPNLALEEDGVGDKIAQTPSGTFGTCRTDIWIQTGHDIDVV